jgi:iron-sulfur cluster repair protein YtfE (RIC family)
MRKRAFYAVLILSLIVGSGLLLAAQNNPQSHTEHHPEAQAPKPVEQSDIMARCQQMMSQRAEMMQRMEAMDKKLDGLVAEMHQAKGSQKIDAVAKVVTEMAAERKQMRESMMQMNEQMMAHMMQHMQDGSAAMCPMMKGMDSAPKK